MIEDFTVHSLTTADLPAVAQLEALTLPGPWDEATLQVQLALPQAVLRGIGPPQQSVVAYVCGWWLAGELEILRLACHPAYRRLGLARLLLTALEEEFRPQGLQRLLLEVRAGNAAAIAFYRCAGFVEAGRRRHYYPDGEDAVLMDKAVVPPAE